MASPKSAAKRAETPAKEKSSSSSIVFTMAKIGFMTAFAPVVIPYYVAKTGFNMALYPARAAYAAATDIIDAANEGTDSNASVAEKAQRTVLYCWENSRPYVEIALPEGILASLDMQVKRLTDGAPPANTNTNANGFRKPPHVSVARAPTDDMYTGAASPQPAHRSSGSEGDFDLDLGLEPMSPLSSTSDALPTPRDPTSNASTTDDMMFYTASAANVSTGLGGSSASVSPRSAWTRRRRSSVEDMTLPLDAPTMRAGAATADETVIIHSKSVKPRKAIMYIQDGLVCWSFASKIYSLKGLRTLPVDKIKNVVPGKRTEGFQGKHAQDVDASCCVSLVSDEKGVAVQFRDAKARDDFVKALTPAPSAS